MNPSIHASAPRTCAFFSGVNSQQVSQEGARDLVGQPRRHLAPTLFAGLNLLRDCLRAAGEFGSAFFALRLSHVRNGCRLF